MKVIIFVQLLLLITLSYQQDLPPPNRPPPSERTFNSEAIEKIILEVKSVLTDPVLALMFEQDFPNTLDTTVYFHGINATTGRPDTFIITGDIQAMWQRDSTNQVLPYLEFMGRDPKLQDLILGLINRQIHNVLIDPYANAYNIGPTDAREDDGDITTKLNSEGKRVNGMTPWTWERKYEIDSLAAVLKLQVEYFNKTGGDDSFMHEDYFNSLESIYTVLQQQQLGTMQEDQINRVPYTFERSTMMPTDTTSHGRCALSTGSDGMVKSFFRPSDDATTLPYFIPGNAMLAVYLEKTSVMIAKKNKVISSKFLKLSQQITEDIFLRGTTKNAKGEVILAYEIDGYGNAIKMDDANIPSLLSLPYLGFLDQNDPLYINTRETILDLKQNPYLFTGKAGTGIGGPHVGDRYIWPMSIITRAITTDDDEEIMKCLETLKTTTANTYFIHESFFEDNADDFTRKWFAWANTFFGELILNLLQRKPHLIIKKNLNE